MQEAEQKLIRKANGSLILTEQGRARDNERRLSLGAWGVMTSEGLGGAGEGGEMRFWPELNALFKEKLGRRVRGATMLQVLLRLCTDDGAWRGGADCVQRNGGHE